MRPVTWRFVVLTISLPFRLTSAKNSPLTRRQAWPIIVPTSVRSLVSSGSVSSKNRSVIGFGMSEFSEPQMHRRSFGRFGRRLFDEAIRSNVYIGGEPSNLEHFVPEQRRVRMVVFLRRGRPIEGFTDDLGRPIRAERCCSRHQAIPGGVDSGAPLSDVGEHHS